MIQLNPIYLIIALLFFAGCKNANNEASIQSSDNAMDAARNFIRATLDGKFDEANSYLLQDSININYLQVGKRSRDNATQDTKDGYRTASIRFHKTIQKNDSTCIIIYSNSFKNDHDSLRLVKNNQQWLVDLKYLFEHGTDSIQPTSKMIDTIK